MTSANQFEGSGTAAAANGRKPRHYKELQIWQKGMELAKAVYVLTVPFPADEKFGLCGQMRRAAVSVPSNIAEGQARHTTREFLQFLSHANGSLAELETQLLLSLDFGYCEEWQSTKIGRQIEELQRMIASVRRTLTARLQISK